MRYINPLPLPLPLLGLLAQKASEMRKRALTKINGHSGSQGVHLQGVSHTLLKTGVPIIWETTSSCIKVETLNQKFTSSS